jgi:hypothetical protein
LPRRTGEKASHLLAVPFDDDLLTLDGQPIQYPAQIARQFGCRNSLQASTSRAEYDSIRFYYNLERLRSNRFPVHSRGQAPPLKDTAAMIRMWVEPIAGSSANRPDDDKGAFHSGSGGQTVRATQNCAAARASWQSAEYNR